MCVCVCVYASVLLQMFLPAVEHSAQHCGNCRCVCLYVRYKAMLLTYLCLSDTALLPVKTAQGVRKNKYAHINNLKVDTHIKLHKKPRHKQ